MFVRSSMLLGKNTIASDVGEIETVRALGFNKVQRVSLKSYKDLVINNLKIIKFRKFQ